MAKSSPPRILFLKQDATWRHWFVELGTDVSAELGPSRMYTSVDADRTIGALEVTSAPKYSKKSDFDRLWSWFRYFRGAAWRALWSSPKTLLFMVAQPPYLPLMGFLKSLFTGQKYVVWVDDVYPDCLVRFKRLRQRGIVAMLWRFMNRVMMRRASRVFTLGPCMAEVYSQYIPSRNPDDILIVPTWVDADGIKPIPKAENSFAREHGQVNKLTVMYSGNFGATHDLGTVVEAARRLREHTDLHFLIIGDGAQRPMLEAASQELPNLSLLPFQPIEVVPFSLTTADISVVSLDRGFEGVSMPSKTYYNMAAGAAILGLSVEPSDLQRVIQDNGCGVNIQPGDVDGFVNAILKFRSDRAYLEQCRHAARRAAVERYSRAVNVHRVIDALRPLVAVDRE